MLVVFLLIYHRETKLSANNVRLLKTHGDPVGYTIDFVPRAKGKIALVKGEYTVKLAYGNKSLTGVVKCAEHTE